jgi:hypothetical protein
VVLRVLRRKFLRALLHNRDRLQPNYCDFSLPGLCCLLENTRHIDREGFEAQRSIQLSYRRAVMGSTTYEFCGLSVLHTLCIIGKLRKFHALSSLGRPEAFVLSNSALILYTTKTTVCAKNLRNGPFSPYKQSCCHVINEKRGADAGIDGIAYFKVGKKDNAKLSFRPNQGRFSQGYRNLGGRCAPDGIPSRRPHHARTRYKTDDDSAG